jgi:hypothetical protein
MHMRLSTTSARSHASGKKVGGTNMPDAILMAKTERRKKAALPGARATTEGTPAL